MVPIWRCLLLASILCLCHYKHDACSTSDGLLNVLCFGAVFADFLPCKPPRNQGQGNFPLRVCELAGQGIFSENAPFIYVRVFHTPAAVTACRRIPALLWEPKQSGNRSRCNTLDFLAKVSVAGVPPALPLGGADALQSARCAVADVMRRTNNKHRVWISKHRALAFASTGYGQPYPRRDSLQPFQERGHSPSEINNKSERFADHEDQPRVRI